MTVKILATYSEAPEDPLTWWDTVELFSFNRRHLRYRDPNTLEEVVSDLAAQLADGAAFWLGYSEHGNCKWSLSSEVCDSWDSRSHAGLLVLGDAADGKTLAERRELARGLLETYTNWCNGAVYDLQIETTCDHCGHRTHEGESVSEVYPDSVDAEARELAGSDDYEVIYQ